MLGIIGAASLDSIAALIAAALLALGARRRKCSAASARSSAVGSWLVVWRRLAARRLAAAHRIAQSRISAVGSLGGARRQRLAAASRIMLRSAWRIFGGISGVARRRRSAHHGWRSRHHGRARRHHQRRLIWRRRVAASSRRPRGWRSGSIISIGSIIGAAAGSSAGVSAWRRWLGAR